ncbi:hypothetical protein BT67DRAFT_381674 [Trichocladium antarcticum]|uniref:Mid2 domain-containing protein n=1 Tax=Trichocladium antarcticum TaxID=1450529 RepID=A0AAN6ZCE4_9PEZI|nr:hypothetical protein BT67DRAFT_381674 [Trichocladium antarcticum]
MKLFWATSLLYIVPIRAAQSCYFPNGSPSPGTAPCDPDAENSMCCDKSQGAFCLSNKLCRGPDGNLIRGACTDRNWAAPECAYYCLSANRGGHDLISCSNVTNTDTSYCCDGHRDFCCNDGVARFEVLPANPQIWATYDLTSSKFIVQRAAATSTPPTGSSAALLSSTPIATTGTHLVSQTPSSAFTPPGQPTEATSPSGLPTVAIAGIAACGVVVVSLAVAIAFLVWKLRRNKARLLEEQAKTAEMKQQMTAQAQAQAQGQYGYGPGQAGYYPYKAPLPPQEVDACRLPTEVDGYRPPAELPAPGRRSRF